jgi:hypothetical protein
VFPTRKVIPDCPEEVRVRASCGLAGSVSLTGLLRLAPEIILSFFDQHFIKAVKFE